MIVRPLTEAESERCDEMMRKVEALKEAGVCPTCRNLGMCDVYPPANDRTFFENDLVCCFLEAYPRNPGHTIVLVKPHYEDISCLPLSVGMELLPVIHAAIGALKKVLEAEKVYLCTMCDGRRNHLHSQLIPRLAGDEVLGSRLFVKERCILDDYTDVVEQLKSEMKQGKRSI